MLSRRDSSRESLQCLLASIICVKSTPLYSLPQKGYLFRKLLTQPGCHKLRVKSLFLIAEQESPIENVLLDLERLKEDTDCDCQAINTDRQTLGRTKAPRQFN